MTIPRTQRALSLLLSLLLLFSFAPTALADAPHSHIPSPLASQAQL